jgi:hypothetical protein
VEIRTARLSAMLMSRVCDFVPPVSVRYLRGSAAGAITQADAVDGLYGELYGAVGSTPPIAACHLGPRILARRRAASRGERSLPPVERNSSLGLYEYVRRGKMIAFYRAYRCGVPTSTRGSRSTAQRRRQSCVPIASWSHTARLDARYGAEASTKMLYSWGLSPPCPDINALTTPLDGHRPRTARPTHVNASPPSPAPTGCRATC